MTKEQHTWFLLGRIKELSIACNKVLDIHGSRKVDATRDMLLDELKQVNEEVYERFIRNEIREVYYTER